MTTATHNAKTLADYSERNAQAILRQSPHATRLAGYKGWQAMGRQVRKGEHGIVITAPITKEDKHGRKLVNVRSARVFDISQTEEMSEAVTA